MSQLILTGILTKMLILPRLWRFRRQIERLEQKPFYCLGVGIRASMGIADNIVYASFLARSGRAFVSQRVGQCLQA